MSVYVCECVYLVYTPMCMCRGGVGREGGGERRRRGEEGEGLGHLRGRDYMGATLVGLGDLFLSNTASQEF